MRSVPMLSAGRLHTRRAGPGQSCWARAAATRALLALGVPHVHVIYSRHQGGPSGCLGVGERGHGPSDPCVRTGGRNWLGPKQMAPCDVPLVAVGGTGKERAPRQRWGVSGSVGGLEGNSLELPGDPDAHVLGCSGSERERGWQPPARAGCRAWGLEQGQ